MTSKKLPRNRFLTDFVTTIAMGKVIIGMTSSLDGYIEDESGDVSRLYPDLKALRETEMMKAAIESTGAVVMGRQTFDMAQDPDWYAGNYEFQTPIFVLTHEAPEKHPKESDDLKFTFVAEGVEEAIQQAKRAAGDKDVMVIGGASTFQQCISAGLCDEIQIGIMPVLLGGGLRLFANMDGKAIRLEKIKVFEATPDRVDVVYRLK
jgi:dihydrofolate reductase